MIWIKLIETKLQQNTTKHVKKIGHLFYATLSFVHNFMAIGEFKLELQSGNNQIELKSEIIHGMYSVLLPRRIIVSRIFAEAFWLIRPGVS